MLPSRNTLRSWNPDALADAASAVESSAGAVANSVTGINDAIDRMSETKGWAGAEGGAAVGALFVPFAWATVPVFATLGAITGGAGLSKLGTAIGEVACPY